MKELEAAMVARVITAADSGCLECVANLTCELVKALPWHEWFDLVAEASQGEWTAKVLRDASCMKEGP